MEGRLGLRQGHRQGDGEAGQCTAEHGVDPVAVKQKGPASADPGPVNWWRFRDSNPGPADYDSVALTD